MVAPLGWMTDPGSGKRSDKVDYSNNAFGTECSAIVVVHRARKTDEKTKEKRDFNVAIINTNSMSEGET